MSNSFVLPGNNTAYVPSLTSDLVVEFSRNPNKFPIADYISYRVVEEQRGYYIKMLNDGQNRVVNDNDWLWPAGKPRPKQINGNDEFTFEPYECVRRSIGKTLDNLSAEQAAWAIIEQASRFSAMQLMTGRARRIHETLTTSANWPSSNYSTATSLGGGTWASASSTNTYIRNSITNALVTIKQQTLGVVDSGDLIIAFSPSVARVIATSQEYLQFLAQQPRAVEIWEAQEQFRTYGMPDYLMGIRCIVDDTTYNSAVPAGVTTSSTASENFTLSSSYAVILTKQKAVNSAAGGAFSTVECFLYEDMTVERFEDPEHRLTSVYVAENLDTSSNILVAPQSGYLIRIDQ